jgi:EAL domain-containing protein (putative c-di-GMP-specific phosphodiesterase class I)
MSIVNAMIAMGRGMNLNVVAEGVESESQLTRLQQMKCHEMQGYYYSAPVSGHEATTLLGRHSHGFGQAGRAAN